MLKGIVPVQPLVYVENLSRTFKTLSKQDPRPSILKRMTAEAPTTEDYNWFLFSLALNLQPDLVVETGTDRGRSAGHFASGWAGGRVVTIDIDKTCTDHARDLGFENITAITRDSIYASAIFLEEDIDILFLDSLHTYEHTKEEYTVYLPKVSKGGLIFVDDINLDEGMKKFWAEIKEPKVDLSHLHYSGFGVILK